MSNLKAFVTGGSRGIGSGIVDVLSDNGYDVAFTYNSQEDEAIALAEKIKAKGVNCYYFQASLDKQGVAETVTQEAIKALGGIDLMVCNAGVTRHSEIINMQGDYMDFLYNLLYRSYLLCTREATKSMVENNVKGNVVFITSTRGFRAYPNDHVYGSMKAALNRSCESLALDLAQYGIRINAIAPGYTAVRGEMTMENLTRLSFTQDIPLKRGGTPREVGYLVKYLASKEADYMTGNIIKLDGGLILPGMPERA